MKNQVIKRLVIVGMFVVITLTPAFGQFQAELVVNIPFSFTVGKKTLPEGRYFLRPANRTGLRSNMLIRNKDAGVSLIVSTDLIQKKVIEKRAKLIFNRYGDQYFLSQVHMPETKFAREMPRSDIEVKLIASGAE